MDDRRPCPQAHSRRPARHARSVQVVQAALGSATVPQAQLVLSSKFRAVAPCKRAAHPSLLVMQSRSRRQMPAQPCLAEDLEVDGDDLLLALRGVRPPGTQAQGRLVLVVVGLGHCEWGGWCGVPVVDCVDRSRGEGR